MDVYESVKTISKLNPNVRIVSFKIKNDGEYAGYVDLFNVDAFDKSKALSNNVTCNMMQGSYASLINSFKDKFSRFRITGMKIKGNSESTLTSVVMINEYKTLQGYFVKEVTVPYQLVKDMIKEHGSDPRYVLDQIDFPTFNFCVGDKSSMKITLPPYSEITLHFFIGVCQFKRKSIWLWFKNLFK